ncbi:CAP domain-containing protein [Aquibacillus rhizosphaerae]|uniref:CAP domain-containing protein n=1 Tax=Aquibacillus rhizosphaerae TaxID=3051431 RepID=A0ABT7LBF4_9BACI|nr:CAP domain-containing protein [Aquibacillus sp. LR5S19]MDL4843196.1 CAP domain-containing protein [Aquibacillus sp. LR5S19]
MKKVTISVLILCSIFFLAACNNNNQESLMETEDENQVPRQVNYETDNSRIIYEEDIANRQQSDEQDEKRYSGLTSESTTINEDRQNQTTRNINENNNAKEKPKQTNDQVSETMGDFQTKVVELTNQRREEKGLAPLDADPELTKVAQVKAEDMANSNYFSHTSPNYGSPFDMMKQFGVEYTTAAENIAAGQTTPDEVVKGWMNSEGHRKNILNEQLTHIGVGFAENGNQWTQMFIKK